MEKIGKINIPKAQNENEKEKKARLISRYIETKIIQNNEPVDEEEEQEIREYYEKMSPSEKANIMYSKVMAFMTDKQIELVRKNEAKSQGTEYVQEESDPYLISEIKILFEDKQVKELIPETYGVARIDAKDFQISELGNLWDMTNAEINRKELIYKKLEQDIHLGRVEGKGKASGTKSRMARLADNLASLEKRKVELGNLEGFSKTEDNTDAVAQFQYKTLKEYKEQLKNGFVWLPSRKRIHKETVSAILNHRWPVLVGEAGTGKSDQADAAAMELTGYAPTEVECENNTSEKQLIMDVAIDPETGGSYDKYEALMQAFTGYENSIQVVPTAKSGRIARFDESGRLGPKAYAVIKKARQKKPGEDFYGKPMLPGASSIWTTNPVGPRYPDRNAPDPAMRRELAEIVVDYPDMTCEISEKEEKYGPELYEFALTTLFDENNHIAVAKEELAPAYEKKDIPEDKREVLKDGSIVIAEDRIIENMSDERHGSLWRFCGAIKSLQDSFVNGNAGDEKYPDTLLRYKEDENGKIEIATDGSGEPLTLSTSTVTLGELASWMSGFNDRKQKQDKDFHVETLTEWLNFKVKTYLKQTDKADKGKIEAIFKHFHFPEGNIPDLKNAKPLTPKEIGYLSPRVPRPVYLEKPINKDAKDSEEESEPEVKDIIEYETKQVLLENGERILLKVKDFEGVSSMSGDLQIKVGKNLLAENGNSFSFVGIVEDENSSYNGQLIGEFSDEEGLYRIFSPEEADFALLRETQAWAEREEKTLEEDIREECK